MHDKYNLLFRYLPAFVYSAYDSQPKIWKSVPHYRNPYYNLSKGFVFLKEKKMTAWSLVIINRFYGFSKLISYEIINIFDGKCTF